MASIDVPKDTKGRIKVNQYLEVDGHPGLWALGDLANIPDLISGRPYPPTAQHAVREGRLLASNLAARLEGRPLSRFDYRSLGQMALVGERTGVADVMGHRFSGFFAWFLWRSYYLMQIPQTEKRLRVMLDWTLDLFFERDIVQLAVTRQGLTRGPLSN
jgi:NADH dehydrogenase